MTGPVNIVRLKLRPDTPQDYEDIHYRDITLDSPTGTIFLINPWKQYFDLKGQPLPKSTVRNVTLSGVKGKYGSFGTIEGNPDTQISDIAIENIDVTLKTPKLQLGKKEKEVVTLKDVKVNGEAMTMGK